MNNTHNNLIIPFISQAQGQDMLAQAGARLDEHNKQLISHALWIDVPQKPLAEFAIAHSCDVIFLKYYVSEKHIAAVHRHINAPVYKDSCVEFFISLGNDLNYYNLEFNCAGTVLGGYGTDKKSRRFLNRNLLRRIRTEANVSFNKENQLFEWQLTVAIPVTVFEFHQIEDFSGVTCRLNFFKCGDDLPEPHYLAWNIIDDAEPNFHRPEYFGTGMFERSGIVVEL